MLRGPGPYGHLRDFCRAAEPAEWHPFWQRAGELAIAAIARGEATWCNTHGTGVPWLHLRFDRAQKYAAFPPSGAIDAASQAQWYRTIYELGFGAG